MGIVFSRVDGRMIHGQVAIAWTRLLAIDEIIAVSDEAAYDETQNMLLEIACPVGVALSVCSIEEGIEKIKEEDFEGSRTMVIFKTLEDALRVAEGGVQISSLNIGGVYFKEGKTKYEKALCLDTEDENIIKRLSERIADVFYQVAPMNEKEPISKYVK